MRRYVAAGLVMAIVFVAGFLVRAQVQPPNASNPTVLSGADIGFRIERWEGDTPVGRWVVRNRGAWVEPKTSVGTRRVTSN
jgi:hypothetical protein